MNDPKRLRNAMQKASRECPCCGAAVIIRFTGDPGAMERYLELIEEYNIEVRLERVEDAEEDLRRCGAPIRFEGGL